MPGRDKDSDARTRNTPGPQDYHVPTRSSSPSYSMGQRLHYREGSDAPGPGRYNATNDHLVRRESPSYSMGARSLPSPDNKVPGPVSFLLSSKKVS